MKKKDYIIRIIAIFLGIFCYNCTVFASVTAKNNIDSQEYLQHLTPAQQQAVEQTAEERLNNLSPAQKQALMQTAQNYLMDISPEQKKALVQATRENLNVVDNVIASNPKQQPTAPIEQQELTPNQKQALQQLQQAAIKKN